MDCDLELFTFADNCFRGLKHIKHFCSHSVFDFGIRIGSVRHRPRDFQLLSGQKFCHYLGGDKGGRGVKANGDKRWQGGEGGQKSGFLRWYTFWLAPWLILKTWPILATFYLASSQEPGSLWLLFKTWIIMANSQNFAHSGSFSKPCSFWIIFTSSTVIVDPLQIIWVRWYLLDILIYPGNICAPICPTSNNI